MWARFLRNSPHKWEHGTSIKASENSCASNKKPESQAKHLRPDQTN